MEGFYKVRLEEKEIGTVQVNRKGLYYQITCSVNIPKGCYYHLFAVSDKDEFDLGLCVPGDQYGFTTNQPVKKFTSDEYTFILSKKKNDHCVPVFADKPFLYLHKLHSGRYMVCDGIPSIVFSESHKS